MKLPTPKKIVFLVARTLGLAPSEVTGKKKRIQLSHARRIVAYVLHEHYGYDYKTIAEALGREDHTTAMGLVNMAKRYTKPHLPYPDSKLYAIRMQLVLERLRSAGFLIDSTSQ